MLGYDPKIVGGTLLNFSDPLASPSSVTNPLLARARLRYSDTSALDFEPALIKFLPKQRLYRKILTDMGTPYDLTNIQNFCALVEKKVSHLTTDETGSLSFTEKNVEYSTRVVSAVAKKWCSFSISDSFKMSLRRGTNSGAPLFVSGSNRVASDFYLYCTILYVYDRMKKKYSLADIYSEVGTAYAPITLAYGERKQRTPKAIPFKTLTGIKSSESFEPRVRAIFFSPKLAVIYNRLVVKKLSSLMKSIPQHSVDQKVISDRISSMKKNFKYVIALDQSKFDRRHGYKRGLSILDCCTNICDHFSLNSEGLRTEFLTPILLPTFQGNYAVKGGAILSSGVSPTTLFNCLGSDLDMCSVVSNLRGTTPDQTISALGKDWDYQNWGDDLIVASNDLDLSKWKKGFSDLGLEVDAETQLRFLGVMYDKGERATALSSMLASTLEPERVKTRGALHVLAYSSRFSQLDLSPTEKNKLFELCSPYTNDMILRSNEKLTRFPTSEDVIQATNWVSTHVGDIIQDLDDMVFSLGHGNEDESLQSLLGLDTDVLDKRREEYLDEDKFVFELKNLYPSITPDSFLQSAVINNALNKLTEKGRSTKY